MSKGCFEFYYPDNCKVRFNKISLSSGEFVMLVPEALSGEDLEDVNSVIDIFLRQINRPRRDLEIEQKESTNG